MRIIIFSRDRNWGKPLNTNTKRSLQCLTLRLGGYFLQGSMPTDGTLFLENVPKRKQYLLTLLSVFFSFGAVLSALIGILVIPRYSCPEGSSSSELQGSVPPCDVEKQNQGWRYLLMTLSVIVS
jgi:MFS family permease